MTVFKRVQWVLLLALLTTTCFFSGPSALLAQGPAGFTIDYQDSWPLNGRMKFIRILIQPVAGVSARDLDFHIVARSSGYRSPETVVSTIVRIRKGDTSAVGELYVPINNGNQFTIHAELDGNKRYGTGDFARHTYYEYYDSNNTSANGFSPSFLIASSNVVADESIQFLVLKKNVSNIPRSNRVSTTAKFPAFDDLQMWYPDSAVYGGGKEFMTFNGISSPYAAALSLDSLPSKWFGYCLLYTSPSPRDATLSRMPSSA